MLISPFLWNWFLKSQVEHSASSAGETWKSLCRFLPVTCHKRYFTCISIRQKKIRKKLWSVVFLNKEDMPFVWGIISLGFFQPLNFNSRLAHNYLISNFSYIQSVSFDLFAFPGSQLPSTWNAIAKALRKSHHHLSVDEACHRLSTSEKLQASLEKEWKITALYGVSDQCGDHDTHIHPSINCTSPIFIKLLP